MTLTREAAEYFTQHRPSEDAPTLDDLTGGDGTYPSDVYQTLRYFGHGEAYDQSTFAVIRSARGNPGQQVTIYRAAPPGVPTISPGDWVALAREYAVRHSYQDNDPSHDWPVYSARVPAHTIRASGNDLIEFGYWGSPVPATLSKESSMQTTAEADTSGVMIALVPDKEASKALMEASEATEPLDQQHLTLLYLGSTDEAGGEAGRTALLRGCYAFALGTGRNGLTGRANGWGLFQNDDAAILVALWDIPGIAEFRPALQQACAAAGAPMRTEDHGFTPHSTMTYLTDPDPVTLPDRLDPQPEVTFESIALAWGEDDWVTIPLAGPAVRAARLVAEAGPARGGNPDNPGQFSTQDKGYRKKQKTPKSTDDKAPDAGSGGPTSREAPQEPPTAPAGSTTEAPSDSGAKDTPAAPEKATQPVEQDEQGHTGVTPPKGPLDEQQRIAAGDVYGKYLSAGKYSEGDPRNEPEFDRIMQEKTDLTDQFLKATPQDVEAGRGGDSQTVYDKHKNPETGAMNVYDAERTALHEQILTDLEAKFADFPKEHKAVVMAGPPGAGKSTLLKGYGDKMGIQNVATDPKKFEPGNFVTINPDDFKELLPLDATRYPGLKENELAAMKHEESSMLAKRATDHFMAQGYNVIIDITLGSADSAQRKYMDPKWAGDYDYQVALCDGDMRNSLNNAGLRYKQPDKETGERTYSGRFLPMHLIETNAPTKDGYRSKNAEQFEQFAHLDGVKQAWTFDPYAPDKGLQDAKGVMKALSALAGYVSGGLSGILRAERGGTMPEQAKTAKTGGEIVSKIQDYADGKMTEDQIVQYLAHDARYVEPDQCPYEKGSAQWWNWYEGNGFQPGTYDEITRAVSFGQISHDTFAKINAELLKGAEKVQ